MFRVKSILFPACTLILGMSLATAQPDDEHSGMGKMDPQKMADRMTEKLTKELKLNDDQKAKVHQTFLDGMEQMKDMRPAAGEMHGDLMKQMRAASLDTAALNRDFNAHQTKMREMHAIRIKHFAELYAVLTPEQRIKFADIMEKRGEEMKGRWGKGRDKQEDSK